MPPKSTALVRVSTDAILAPILTAEIVEGLSASATKAERVKALAAQFSISNDAEEAKAGEYLKAIHVQHKALEEERKAIAGPLTQAKKALDARYKPALDDLDVAKAAIARMLGTYRVEKAKAQALLVAKSTEEAQTPEERRALIVMGTEEAPKLAGLREVVSYEVRVEDANAIERAFLMPDLDAAKGAIAASEGKFCPKGFAFERVTKMVPTGR